MTESVSALADVPVRARLWESEPFEVAPFGEAIASWRAHTPPGTLIEVQLRAGTGSVWSQWAVAARWSAGIDYDVTGGSGLGANGSDCPAADGTADVGTAGVGAAGVGAAAEVTPGGATGGGGGWPDFHSHTVADQAPFGLRVDADTIAVNEAELGGPASRVEVRALLFAPEGSPLPRLERVSVLTRPKTGASTAEPTVSQPRGRDIDLRLPAFSQRLAGAIPGHADGGSWCSPTSLAMLLAYARTPAANGSEPEPASGVRPGSGPGSGSRPGLGAREAAPAIAETMRRVWDYSYGGAGNWAFNAAWAASLGFDAYVDALPDLRAGEELLAAGEPFAASVTFAREDLPEAGYETAGHLLVVSGVTAEGDVRVHDPAAADNASVRRTYARAAFERAWLGGSGGIVYRVRS
ncbi:C39 family peptidase [Brevibacterium sp. BRM-1]|uniref:C39 family peptidase n=1 Tax=Brevibacterium sp. BRM-1 TaxID=2999062 RepID=UPI0022817B3A|nr:C39 family peptidase [Brevibacterium sp. BRM-1]WAL41406.1 C39 family peptidase [Brevibacterium sp. BRM-1]